MLTMVPLVLVLVPVVVAVAAAVVTVMSVTIDCVNEIYLKNRHLTNCELIHHSFWLLLSSFLHFY